MRFLYVVINFYEARHGPNLAGGSLTVVALHIRITRFLPLIYGGYSGSKMYEDEQMQRCILIWAVLT